jgi:MFS family permease
MAMLQGMLKRIFGSSGKTLVANIVILANAFVWYSYAFTFLTTSISSAELSYNFLSIMSIHFLGVFSSVIIGELVSRKIKNRIRFLLYWMAAGVFLSLIPFVANVSTYLGIVTLSVITGVTFGFGIPACLGYFAASTDTANRGRLGGITFLLVGVGAYLLSLVGSENTTLVILVLTAWKTLGVVLLLTLNPEEIIIKQKQKISYREVLSNKTFVLYFIPWTMFLLVNSLIFPINERYFSTELVRISSSIEFVLGGVSAVIFGFLADAKGRKRLAVAGFALLGLGHAILGFSEGNMIGWWFYTFVDGVAWGIFVTIFLFTLWGDLAEEFRSERYYAIGILPYLLSTFLRFSIGALITNAIINYSVIFSFASFFLFLAVLPLVYAPETLPQKIVRDRELKNYLEKAQKEAIKAQKKQDESLPRENDDNNTGFEKTVIDEKLREAEKYY